MASALCAEGAWRCHRKRRSTGWRAEDFLVPPPTTGSVFDQSSGLVAPSLVVTVTVVAKLIKARDSGPAGGQDLPLSTRQTLSIRPH